MTGLSALRRWLRPAPVPPVEHDVDGLVRMLYEKVRKLEKELHCYRYLVPRLVEPPREQRCMVCGGPHHAVNLCQQHYDTMRKRVVEDIIANDTGTAGEAA